MDKWTFPRIRYIIRSNQAPMAILLKCSTRKHTLKLNPRRYWATTYCPHCRGKVDPIRIRRIVKLPGVLFQKDFVLFPLIVKSTILPIFGLLALITGSVLTYISWPSKIVKTTEIASAAATSNAPSVPEVKSVPPNFGPTSTYTASNSQSNSSVAALASSAIPASNANVISPIPAPQIQSSATATPTPVTVRYSTGTNLIRPSDVGGRGSRQISNGTSSDAIAKLVDSETNKTVRLVYIQASSNFTIGNIRPGNYVLKFSLGTGYDEKAGKFISSQSFAKFDDLLKYTEEETETGIYFHKKRVTLNPVPNGNASTSPISESDFDNH